MLAKPKTENLTALLKDVRACRICAKFLPYGVRPVIRLSATARICITSQAPGLRVHQTGVSFNDRSGDRLRDWLGVSREEFYDEAKIAIIGMGFCFPGYDEHGADKPPRPECAPTWHARIFAAAPRFPLILPVGGYAQHYHLGDRIKSNMTETVRAWRQYGPRYIPLPHPSWRNNGWLKKNPWFEAELLPYLRRRVRRALSSEL